MVKRRRYDAPVRRAQAAATRAAVLDAAQGMFFSNGYAGTTIAGLADAAGVSAETIYKTYGGKPGVMRALCERGFEGRGLAPAEQRSDAMSAVERDARAMIRQWTTFSIEVAPIVSPLLLLLRAAAATHPELEPVRRALDDRRLARMAHNARRLCATGQVRRGLGARHVRDVLWTSTSPELYQLLVLERGWPIRAYARHLGDAMVGALL